MLSIAVAVGQGAGASIAALGSIMSPLLPRMFGPPFGPSDARAVGQGAGRTAGAVRPSRLFTGTLSKQPVSLWSRAVAVGHTARTDEQAVAAMGRADSRSRDLDGACFKAVRFHVSENSGEAQFCACKARDILDEKEPGAGSAGEVAEVRPEVALVLMALALTGEAPRLAGDAAGKKIDPPEGCDVLVAKGAEIRSNRDIWPVDGKLGAAALVSLDEADDAAPCELEAEGESADS